jgi:hypothetical protein
VPSREVALVPDVAMSEISLDDDGVVAELKYDEHAGSDPWSVSWTGLDRSPLPLIPLSPFTPEDLDADERLMRFALDVAARAAAQPLGVAPERLRVSPEGRHH